MSKPLARLLLFFVAVFFIHALVEAQPGNRARISGLFREVVLVHDTSMYLYSRHTVQHQGARHLYFHYSADNPVCELRFYPNQMDQIEGVSLIKSQLYQAVDSLVLVGNEYFMVRLRFNEIAQAQFPGVSLMVLQHDQSNLSVRENIYTLRLFPYTSTSARLLGGKEEIFVGEEEIFELSVNRPENIRADNIWTSGLPVDYKMSERNGRIRIHFVANELGTHTLSVPLSTRAPFLDEYKNPGYTLPPLVVNFQVSASRIPFLRINREDIILEDALATGMDIEMDYHRTLGMRRTYRIENQEQPGGMLIGEIFTKSKLSSNRVLCSVRLFSLHRKSEGYLYIKDGDKPVSVTNIDIIPRTTITKVSITRDGADWTDNLSVQPGDTLDLRIEGKSLNKAEIYFEGLTTVKQDSAVRSENMLLYKIRIPYNVAKRRISIYNRQQHTGFALNVREFQRARALDFVSLNYGQGDVPLNSLKNIVLVNRTIPDVVFTFDNGAIDDGTRLYGKQYLEVEVRITSQNNQLLEFRKIDNLVICPDDNSVRAAFYDRKDCSRGNLQLNSFISRKTSNLEDWTRIELTIRHRADRHGGEAYTQKVELILQKMATFDIDVSFPAGLITKKVGEDGFGSLGGISLAVIAQFRFYQPEKIASLRPYRIGVGALALNAFNFNTTNDNRDLGLVVLGSVYPTRRDVKLSFPLFAGFGYLIRDTRWFFLIGPGVRVQI